jgi:hypothetical protein
MKRSIITILVSAVMLLTFSCKNRKAERHGFNITVTLADTVYDTKVSGRLALTLHKDTADLLVYGIAQDNPQPLYTVDIEDLEPGETIEIKSFDNWWYKRIEELEGTYAMRVVLDIDTIKRGFFLTGGNSLSEKHIVNFDVASIPPLDFTLQYKYIGWNFNPVKNIEEVLLRSSLLSEFWNYDMNFEAAVILPPSYNKYPEKKYPVVYVFPGFGADHASVTYGTSQIDRYGMNTVGNEKIFVFCNGEFRNGYHHFADSENNGPWGMAFTEELIPYIENKYRVIPGPEKRFLVGQSSGAWATAWLQVRYPNTFNGAFISSPDPLDFRAHGYNIYRDEANFYFPENPDSASIAKGEHEKLYTHLEDVLGEYGQILTWESTFSPAGKNGRPAELFNRETGEINSDVALAWKEYDIAYIIKSNPDKYRELLKDKIHIFVSMDDYYGLQRSVIMVDELFNELNISADIQFFDSLGHNVWTDKLREYIHSVIDSNSFSK